MNIYLYDLIVFLSLVAILYVSSVKLEEIDPHKLSLEAHSKREHERAHLRQLIYDTGSNRQCFDVNYNRGYEDYLKNPFKANNNRGDWGKCMPELLFSALCIHEELEKLNDGSWQVSDGPLHEAPSEQMFLALKSLHSSQCLHVDIEFSTLMKEKLNDYFFARNEYALQTVKNNTNSFSFVVTVSNGNFIINGKRSPSLTLIKGSTYAFFMTGTAYAINPILIGTSVGVPHAPVYVTDEYNMKKITFPVPFNTPSSLVYYSSNATVSGNTIIPQDPVQLNIVPRGGLYYINDQPQPTLTLHVGVTYTFVVKNSDQKLFPFVFGTAVNTPYLSNSAIKVAVGSYATRFTVLFASSTVPSLVYYCQNNPFMTGGINIVSGSHRQLMSTEAVLGTSSVDDTITCNGNYLDPRAAIQGSLFCLLSNLAQSLPTAITQKPFFVSNTCDQIARSYLTSSIYYPAVWPPYQYCDQAPVAGIDSCTVISNVNFWTNQGRSCKDYCEAFPGLTCAAAAVPEWSYLRTTWQPQCMARRQWSCTTPQNSESYLLCTCASKAQLPSSVMTPSTTATTYPTLVKSSPTAALVSPSSAPSAVPITTTTTSPSSIVPISAASPSTKPTTVSPTVSKKAPSIKPTTVSPTVSKTASPSIKPTTVSPKTAFSTKPTTITPTISKTVTPTISKTASPSIKPTTVRPTISKTVIPTVSKTTCRPSKSMKPSTLKPVVVKRAFLLEEKEMSSQKNVQSGLGLLTSMPSPASVVVTSQFNFLRGKCMTARSQGWSYPTCFFKNVTQVSGGWSANVGYFGKQLNANTFSIYGGDTCNGINRAGKVILSCGSTVSSVALESPTCFYTMNFTSPQFCISPSYYSAPTATPVTLNPPGQYVTSTCLAQLKGDDYQSNTFCTQDSLMDTCTTVINNRVAGAVNGSCTQYCGRYGLQCVSAYRNWGCMTTQQLTCSTVISDYTLSCQCGQPAGNAVVLPNANLNTQSCQQILFNSRATIKPDKYCPRNLILSSPQDSCTVWRRGDGRVSCDTFCSSYPGLKCLSAAVGDPSACAINAYYYGAPPLSCTSIPPAYNPLLCACGVDDASMPAVVAAANAPLSNACKNIMTQPEPFAPMDRLCRSDLVGNTCQVSVYTSTYARAVTCSQYCTQFPGMTCVDAQFASGDVDRCAVYTNPNFPTPSCNLNMMRNTSLALCTCGFLSSAPQQNQFMLSHLEPNRPYCPAYPANIDSYNSTAFPTSRRLDDGSDINRYQRHYKKIVVGIDYNSAKADGSATVTGVKTSWDRNDWRIDSYNTNTPEMCTGLESRIRPGDPPGKCSFGNRPNNSVASDCYGKLYSMNFKEASNKCSARGGRLAQVDTPEKLRDLFNLFVNDGELSIGLRDDGGQNWQWDGPSDTKVPVSWFNSTIPFKPYLGNSWTYGDCIIIRFNRQSPSYAPYFTTVSCNDKRTYICQGISTTPEIGGDLLADEGGFCLWYYGNPTISLPDDQSGNFRNTELAHFLLTSPTQSTNKYELLYKQLYSYNIPGHPENIANWKSLTRRQVGQNSDLPVFPAYSANNSFHCHFSPTNFGIARIYGQQHMLERLYTGSAHLHCFCGFKHLGKLVDRCDCTRSGETNNNCLTEHRKILYDETYRQTGEYVSCNNCNNPSP